MLRSTVFIFLMLFLSGPLLAQNGKLKAIESGITLKMESQVSEEGQHKFFLDFRTNDVYQCSNYQIDNEVKQDGNKLVIRMRGVRYVEPCGEGMGPAKSRLDLTDLLPGEYKVRVSINRQIFKAALVISDTYFDFQIQNEDPTLFRIYNGRLNRIPENSIWGLVSYTDPYDKPAAEKFMKDLQAAGAEKTALPVGNYGDFYLHQTGETVEKVIGHEQYEFPFVYSYEGDLTVVEELLNRYQGKVDIVLKTCKGQVLQNQPVVQNQ